MTDDLISRAAALDAIDYERKILVEQGRLGAEHVVVHHARRLIEDLPAVDAVPVVHGRWITKQRRTHYPECKPYEVDYCSVCGKRGSLEYPYCPYCGAKMDAERREKDGVD